MRAVRALSVSSAARIGADFAAAAAVVVAVVA